MKRQPCPPGAPRGPEMAPGSWLPFHDQTPSSPPPPSLPNLGHLSVFPECSAMSTWTASPTGCFCNQELLARCFLFISPDCRLTEDGAGLFYFCIPHLIRGFLGRAGSKEPACQCRRHKRCQVQSLGQKDPLEEGKATHSSILVWKISWTEAPGGI